MAETDHYTKEEYISRINRVIDHIENNYYTNLKLEDLANIANFSKYHFHRIFKGIVGETLNQFILRVRMERASGLLMNNPKKNITDIAFDIGFSSSSTFARSFKEYFGVSASEWRNNNSLYNSKIRQTDSNPSQSKDNIWQDIKLSVEYINGNIQNWRIVMLDMKTIQIEVKEVPELSLAYIRHIGPYQGDSELFKGLFTKLFHWAGPRNLINFPETKMLSVYHNNPDTTDDDKLRMSVCISVPENTEVSGEIGKMKVEAGKYAIGHFEIQVNEYEKAWNLIFGEWLPKSGYQPTDSPCYELYLNNPEEHPEQTHIVDIYIPVKPL